MSGAESDPALTGKPARRSVLTRVNDVLELVQTSAAVALLAVFVSLTFVEIISRAFFARSLIWVPEVATMAFAWTVFLAGAVCFRKGAHLAVDLFKIASPRLARLQRWFIGSANLLLLLALMYFGAQVIGSGFNRGTPILGIPIAVGWLAPVVMGVTSVGFVIEATLAPAPLSVLREGAIRAD